MFYITLPPSLSPPSPVGEFDWFGCQFRDFLSPGGRGIADARAIYVQAVQLLPHLSSDIFGRKLMSKSI